MAPTISKTLGANLQALLARNPTLAERICLSVSDDHVRIEDDGSVSYHRHKDWLPLNLSEDQLSGALDGIASDVDVIVFGLGTGDLLDSTLKHCDKATVAAWEQDPWLLREILERRDYSKEILAGQLLFSLGMDLLDLVPALRLGGQLVTHPLLSQIYSNELRLLREGRGEQAALVCSGGLMVDDLSHALRNEGYSTATWNIEQLSDEELQRTASRLQPARVASINYNHGLAEACQDAGLPLVVWEIDPATDKLKQSKAGRTTHVFTYRRDQEPQYRNAGFSQVEYLPLAANTDFRRPVELDESEAERYCNTVSFVGNSMVERANEFRERLLELYCQWQGNTEQAIDEAHAAITTILSAQSEDWCTYRVPELVTEHLGDFAQVMSAQEPEDHPVVLLAEMAAADKRITCIANLGQVEVAVWGDEGWSDLSEYGVRHMGPAGHREELNRIYSGSSINLDIGRIYQSDIVTMRVFDALACGGFVLTEYSDALSELFDIGNEIDCYRTFHELMEKVEHYMDHPDEARAIAERGMTRVRRDHTIASRTRYMLAAAGLRDAANH